ncbi:TIGR02450 family Trp-rich protein [Methylovulum sp.]|nr:TIGR02450 family Trp-rich protein [Methylovulum sp.]MDD5123113.1 TIGR02450 family Trp-rich protein [Methylovulum sp.]
MNKLSINPTKLLPGKWTAVHPVNQEKHFLVSRLIPVLSETDRK